MMIKKSFLLLALVLCAALLLPALSAAESGVAWADAGIEQLVIAEERYQDLLSRASAGKSSRSVERKYGSLFVSKIPGDMIRESLEAGDAAMFQQACTYFRAGQELGLFSPENAAWLDDLIAAGYRALVSGMAEEPLNMLALASIDPEKSPIFTWSLRVLRPTNIAHLAEFLDLASYTPEEYEADSRMTSLVASANEAVYVCMPDGTAALFYYGGNEKEYTVLSEYEGCPVTTICAGAFMNSGINAVTLPDTLTAIQGKAFFGTPLHSVVIPENVREIGEGAFALTGLDSVVLPGTPVTIGDFAFAANRFLQSLTIPNGVLSIGMSAFSMTSLPDELFIPGSVESIGEFAFAATDHRIGRFLASENISSTIPLPAIPESGMTVIIGNGVREIGQYAFAGRYIRDVSLPESLTSLEDYAFADCGTEMTPIRIPAGVTEIGKYAFYADSTLSRTVNIQVVPGSYAEQFCLENDIPFALVRE